MKPSLSKTAAQEAIATFFERSAWSADELRKLKRLAMKHRIRLGTYRRRFCKNCLLPLHGKINVTNTHRTVVCGSCGVRNKFKHVARA